MAIDPTTIVRGPAIVTYDSVVMYTEGDILVTPKIDTFKVQSSKEGDVDERLSDIANEITFTPIGKWAYNTVLLPHATPSIGSSIFGAVAKALTIQTVAGQLITYPRAAVTKMPDLHLGTVAPLWKQVTFTTVGDPTLEWSNAAKHATIAANAFADTSFDPSHIITQPYTVVWGGDSPWSSITTESGVDVSFDMATAPVLVDKDGTVDLTLENVSVTARFTPVGVSESELLTLLKIQGSGVARGASLQTLNANNLVVSGTGVHFTVYYAAPKMGPTRFGRTILRIGEVGMVATRKYTSGALTALFRAGTAAP